MDEDVLFSDDLLPLDGSLLNLDPPEEQIREEQAERGEVLASAPLIASILAWFDEQIAQCDNIDGIDLESPIEVKAQLMARQIVKARLRIAKDDLEIKQATFVPQYKH
jgi:type IV secretory pathway protease TraF